MKKISLFLIAIIGFGADSFAQNYVDIAKLNYGYVPNMPYEGENGSTNVQDYDAGIVYPIKLSDKLAVITGLDYSNQVVKLIDLNDYTNLHSAGLRLGISIKHSEKWSGLYVAIPKMAGDFGALSSKDFQFGGVAVWKYTKKENFKYKFGVYASTEAFGPIVIPILGGYYLSPNKKFEANLSLPIAYDINYKLAKNFRIGSDLNAIVRSYDLSKTNQSTFYVHRWVIEPSAYLQLDLLDESIIIKARAIYAMNDFGLYGDGDGIDVALPATEVGDDRLRWNKPFGSVLGFKASLIYRFQLGSSAKESQDSGK